MEDTILKILEEHKLRKTNVRKEILGLFLKAGEKALSNSDIESQTGRLDRITLYRTLKAFEEKGLIHKAIDGSGTPKYALCSGTCSTHGHHDEHAHFHCQSCGKTVCMDDITTPVPILPEGYKVEHAHLVISGICKDCP